MDRLRTQGIERRQRLLGAFSKGTGETSLLLGPLRSLPDFTRMNYQRRLDTKANNNDHVTQSLPALYASSVA